VRQAQYARTLSVMCVLCGHMAECGTGTWCIVDGLCGYEWSWPSPGVWPPRDPAPPAPTQHHRILTEAGSSCGVRAHPQRQHYPKRHPPAAATAPLPGHVVASQAGTSGTRERLAVWPGGDGLCGFPPVCGPPGAGGRGGRAGWRGGGTEAPRALPARTSDQGDTGNSVDAADARGPVISVPKPSVQACVRSWWCSGVACGGAAPTSVV
jgi:hypothetical protein